MSRQWKLGEVCEHDSLGRKCEICERDETIKTLRDAIVKARAWLDCLPSGLEKNPDPGATTAEEMGGDACAYYGGLADKALREALENT